MGLYRSGFIGIHCLRLLTVTTDEVTVGVVWAAALRAKVADAKITRAFLIIIVKAMSADVAPDQL
jgi:hypothetical protein